MTDDDGKCRFNCRTAFENYENGFEDGIRLVMAMLESEIGSPIPISKWSNADRGIARKSFNDRQRHAK